MPEILRLSHSLYAPDAISEAVEAFASIATLELTREASETRVEVSWTDPEIPDLLDHFCNHILHHSIVASRQGSGDLP